MIDNHSLLGQRARDRRAPGRLAPGDGHERPGAARHRGQSRRRRQRLSRARPASTSRWRRKSWRSCAWPRISKTCSSGVGAIVVAYRRDKDPDPLPRHQGRWCDDGAAQGRDAAQSGADAGKQSGLRAWRALRQHCAWLQLGGGDHHGLEACRFTSSPKPASARSGGERSFFDIKCRKAGLKPDAAGDRRHGPRHEDEWRASRRNESPGHGKTSRLSRRAAPISAVTCRTSRNSACRWSSPSNHFVSDTESGDPRRSRINCRYRSARKPSCPSTGGWARPA